MVLGPRWTAVWQGCLNATHGPPVFGVLLFLPLPPGGLDRLSTLLESKPKPPAPKAWRFLFLGDPNDAASRQLSSDPRGQDFPHLRRAHRGRRPPPPPRAPYPLLPDPPHPRT